MELEKGKPNETSLNGEDRAKGSLKKVFQPQIRY